MTDQELKELVGSLAIAQQKTDAQLAKTDEKLTELIEQHKETEVGLAKLQKTVEQVTTQLGNMGNIQGEITEDLFRRNIVPLLAERGRIVENVGVNVTMPGTAEYDIVAENGKEVVVLEVKNKLRNQIQRRFLNVQLSRFKREFTVF